MELRRHNSLIRIKTAICKGCNKTQPIQAKGLCQSCYQMSLKLKYLNNSLASDDEATQDGLPDLIREFDAVFSRYVRMSAANKEGVANCFICGKPERWQDCDAMHYVPRASYFLRFDNRNVKCGCKECNQYKGGNLLAYGIKLDNEHLGITEVLLEESRMIYKFTKDELRQQIIHYTNQNKIIQQKFIT